MISETWLPVVGYENLYQVSNLGRIQSIARRRGGKCGRMLAPNAVKGGYQQVTLYKDRRRSSVYVHRLVADAFMPRTDPDTEINHIDGVKSNNALHNLEWMTRSENLFHATRVLGVNHGTLRPNSKIGVNDVREIRRLYALGQHSYRRLAKAYGLSKTTVEAIILRRTWVQVI